MAPPVVNFLYCADLSYTGAEILQTDMRLHLLPETLYLAINIIDCFLSMCVLLCLLLSYSWLALGTCFSDRGTSQHPLLHQLIYIDAKILQVKKYILKTQEWNMSYPKPIHFLCWVSKVDEYNVQVHYCKVLLGDRVHRVEIDCRTTFSICCSLDVVSSLRT